MTLHPLPSPKDPHQNPHHTQCAFQMGFFGSPRFFDRCWLFTRIGNVQLSWCPDLASRNRSQFEGKCVGSACIAVQLTLSMRDVMSFDLAVPATLAKTHSRREQEVVIEASIWPLFRCGRFVQGHTLSVRKTRLAKLMCSYMGLRDFGIAP